jgi:hypothetical protein
MMLLAAGVIFLCMSPCLKCIGCKVEGLVGSAFVRRVRHSRERCGAQTLSDVRVTTMGMKEIVVQAKGEVITHI